MKNKKTLLIVATLFVVTLANAQDARYGIKSGIIKTSGTTQGITSTATIYFDNYGEKEASTTALETPMGKQETMQLTTKDSMFVISLTQKIGQKQALSEQINFLKITPVDIIKYKIKDLGEETVAGKPCKKYSLQQEQMGQTIITEVSVWNGITLKATIKLGEMEVGTQTATEIQENAEIEPLKFEIPEGVTFM